MSVPADDARSGPPPAGTSAGGTGSAASGQGRPTADEVRARLVAAFPGAEIEVVDDSHRHVGHAGAAGGAGHYSVAITAEAFRGLATVRRHRLVYDALIDWIPGRVHALSIRAAVPADPPTHG